MYSHQTDNQLINQHTLITVLFSHHCLTHLWWATRSSRLQSSSLARQWRTLGGPWAPVCGPYSLLPNTQGPQPPAATPAGGHGGGRPSSPPPGIGGGGEEDGVVRLPRSQAGNLEMVQTSNATSVTDYICKKYFTKKLHFNIGWNKLQFCLYVLHSGYSTIFRVKNIKLCKIGIRQ